MTMNLRNCARCKGPVEEDEGNAQEGMCEDCYEKEMGIRLDNYEADREEQFKEDRDEHRAEQWLKKRDLW